MAQPTFNGRIEITAATQLDTNLFEVTANFTDYQGIWYGTNIAIGDLLYVDLSSWSAGNVGKYRVISVISSNPFAFTVLVIFDEPGDVITFDYLGSPIGSAIRPTPNLKLSMALLQTVQLIPENIAVQPQNEDLFDIIDNLGSGSNLTTFTFVVSGTPLTVWNINHGGDSQNYICQIFDSTGSVVLPDSIETVDENNVTIRFGAGQEGRAQLLVFGT